VIKVSNFIANHLASRHGIRQVFMIPGGGAMHLNDAFGNHPKIAYVCNHHEQASSMCAEGYARTRNALAVCVVTSGPGGTNTLTGVIGQWLDSVPVLYVSGQVKVETTIESCRELGLRQLGDQEINIVDIVRPVTKYAAFVRDPLEVKRHVDEAVHHALSGRPGPVWLDVPLNVQGAMIDPAKLSEFVPPREEDAGDVAAQARAALEILSRAERPVLVAGAGIRISGGLRSLQRLVSRLGIPVVTTFGGFDQVPSADPRYIGRIGTIGDRAGNFALQNADVVLSIGSRNNIRQVSYNWTAFARAAQKIVVDIDPAELRKPTVKPDLAVRADARSFIDALLAQLDGEGRRPSWRKWLAWCQERRAKYDVVLPEYRRAKKAAHPYVFMRTLTEQLGDGAIAVAGNGSACVVLFQAGVVKKNQRIFWNSGCASMGYDLPLAIGACVASGRKPVACLAGDGSIQMNLQELQTIVHHQLPIKIFYLDNDGYISMRQTQDSYFDGRHVAADPASGVSFPDIVKVAKAYGLQTVTIRDNAEIGAKVKQVLSAKGPVLCHVKLLRDYIFAPKLSSEKLPDGRMISKPLEDLYPFLDREEFRRNMLVEAP
jgi:acetolactate synthase-1/2/3 large subunit